MAITFLEQKKRQRNLILIFGVVILITAFVIWRGFLSKEKIPPEEIIFRPVRKVEINFEILKNPLLEGLEEFQPIEKIAPIATSTEIGRDNPFIPY